MSFLMTVGTDLAKAIDLLQVDRPAGLALIRRLAERGDRSAILCLSETADGNDEAIKWLKQAAEFESADAAWNLAMIAREQGDPGGMRSWLDRAAELGEPDAIKARDRGYDVASVLEDLKR